jgi:DNA-binding LytR/AlgR family response regulator
MKSAAKILIVEDEMVIAANISLQLSSLGYEVSGIIPRGEEALVHVRENKPDIILLDIQLKGNIDGIETAKLIQQENDIPIIYLTANSDTSYFNRAKETRPQAYISKPFKKLDLQYAVELTLKRTNNVLVENEDIETCSSPYILNDSIFIRNNEKMIKVLIKDIFYIKAERNYCHIYSKNRECLLVMTLKEIDDKLPPEHFLRIHRSFIVNLSHINEVSGTHVVIMKKAIPLSKSFKSDLLTRLQTI